MRGYCTLFISANDLLTRLFKAQQMRPLKVRLKLLIMINSASRYPVMMIGQPCFIP